MIRLFQNVELSSRCNLSCKYCPHPGMQRPKIDMEEKTFSQVLYWMQRFGQGGVNLQGVGESTLHPRFLEYVERIRRITPIAYLSTNGVGVTKEMVRGMKRAGLTRLTVSAHRPEIAQKVIVWCLEEGLPTEWGTGPLNSHTWAGQVKTPFLCTDKVECNYLVHRNAVVLVDGRVVACCLDAEGVSSGGLTVWDDLEEVEFQPYSLCLDCHHSIPEEKFPKWRANLAQDRGRLAHKRVPLILV